MAGFDRQIPKKSARKKRKQQHKSSSVENTLNLAIEHHQAGRLSQAEQVYQEVLQLEPNSVAASYNLGLACKAQGKLAEAVRYYRRAIALQPDLAIAHNNLGNALLEQENLAAAVQSYRQAIQLQPDYVEAYNNLGNALKDQGKLSEAMQCYRQSLQLQPHFAEAYNNLGTALKEQGKFEEAVQAYQQALQLKPDYGDVFNNWGVLRQEQGEFTEAEQCYREALRLKPDSLKAHSNLLFTLGATASLSPAAMLQEAQNWYAQQVLSQGITPLSHRNERNPDRKLRLGYLSPDFRRHSVSYFIEPVIRFHDRTQVEVYCYAQVSQPDEVTKRLQAAADHWRSTVGLSDAEVAQIIQQDQIDILIDLAGHTRGNRLLALARKPAPVQATYLGYFATTGLPAIDYWITDFSLHPENTREQTTESIWRLRRCYVAYQPPQEAPEVVPPPCLSSGTVTFGSFNNRHKISQATVALWSRILQSVPNSRLLIKTANLDNLREIQRLQARFAAQGIAPECLLLRGKTPSVSEHLATYGEVDICLDTTPYTGCTTTCEALWMGVPVLTLAGSRKVERMSASILTAIGRQEWIANSEAEFVQKAVHLASHPQQLQQWREQQRQQMASSPLGDAEGLARALEASYRQMWQRYLGADRREKKTATILTAATLPAINDSVEATFQLAIERHQVGQLEEAQYLYQQVLQRQPHHAPALHFSGLLAQQLGQPQRAVELMSRAIQLQPDIATYYNNLGNVLREQGKLAEAVRLFRQALELEPECVQAYHNLGLALKEQEELEAAAQSFRKALQLAPSSVEAYRHLGDVLRSQGKLEEAVEFLNKALQLNPELAEVHNNLGVVFLSQGKLAEATESFSKALQCQPEFALAQYNLGKIFKATGKLEEAAESFRRALQIKPDLGEAYNSLGLLLQEQGKLTQATQCYRQALQLKPEFVEGQNNLGLLLQEQGKLTEAVEFFSKALQLKPDYVIAHSNLLFALGSHTSLTPAAMLREAQNWYLQQVVQQGITPLSHRHNPDSARKLRLGYVSPDFRRHSVSYFSEPVIQAHDRTQVEVYCYAEVSQEDEVTQRLQAAADCWRSTVGLSDAEVAQLIQQDQIDILIDLAGHTQGNRLLVFARKPAPVQATYLGYFATTGLPTIDYWITDRVLHPEDTLEQTTEQIWPLERCYVAYQPLAAAPSVSPPPCLEKGNITFASFNNLRKVTPATLDLWARILQTVPNSRLLLKTTNLADPQEQQRLQQEFAARGVELERLSFRGRTASGEAHLATYSEVDICLDTTPYNGCTTTCEALWMGVPVLTLAGSRKIERMSASILTAIGRQEWIANSEAEFVQKAVHLASHPQQLRQWREQQRQQMASSPLLDAGGLARALEAAYRQMWQRCACRLAPASFDVAKIDN